MWTYINQNISKAYDWWYQPNQTQLTPLQTLRKHLQISKYHPNVLQKICMYFAQLISSHPQSTFQISTADPIFTQNIQSMYLSIITNIKIHTKKVNCNLKLIIYFNQKDYNTQPIFFIQNTQPSKMKPNKHHLQFYKQVIGGLIIIKFSDKQDTFTWQNYHPKNLLKLYQKTKVILQQYFPFVKKSNQDNIVNSNPFEKLHKIIGKYPQDFLQKIQNGTILNAAIQSQINFINSINNHIKQQIIKCQSQSDTITHQIEKIISVDGTSQLMLDLISQQQSLNDCSRELQQMFIRQIDPSNTKVTQYLQTLKNISQKIFITRYQIHKLTLDLQQQHYQDLK